MKRIQLGKHNLDEAVAEAAEILIDGGVVLLPTDTAYGLAADAARDEAVQQVREMKGRDAAKALSVIVSGRPQAEAIAEFNPAATKLWDKFMPGPLTLVLPLSQGSGLKHGSEDTVGIRCPENDLDIRLAERFERPYTATSANRTGAPPAYRPDEFLDAPKAAGDDPAPMPHLVIDAGELPMRPVSTVVEVLKTKAKVLREGAIPKSEIEAAVS
jgi:L-threonylcarbamoyladenylate synthase